MRAVTLGGRTIGPDEPIFITVETGTTCNGKLDTALRLVDAAKNAGADAIKFMIIDPDYFMSDRTVTYEYEWAGGRRSENMYEMFKGLQFSVSDWERIRDHCRERGIIFYATVDYVPGVDLAERLDVAAYKLSSWDARHVPLIRRMARTGKPVQVDAGPATLVELQKLVDLAEAEGNDQIIVVHCSHAAREDEINLNSIPYLERVFERPVGYSADSRDQVPDLVAVGLGARLLEKRLTLDRAYPGHHHVKALEPEEFAAWVRDIRRAERMRGELAVRPSAEDLRQKQLYFVSLVAATDIQCGATIAEEMLACKRPGTGIAPELAGVIVGRRARRDLKRDELLTWDAV